MTVICIKEKKFLMCCIFGNLEIFAIILLSRIALKNIFAGHWGVKKSQLWHDLPLSVNDIMISPFRKDFHFHETSHMRSFAKIKPSRKFSESTVYIPFWGSLSFYNLCSLYVFWSCQRCLDNWKEKRNRLVISQHNRPAISHCSHLLLKI